MSDFARRALERRAVAGDAGAKARLARCRERNPEPTPRDPRLMPKPGDWLYAPRISKRGGSFVASLRVEVVRIFWQGDLLQALVDVRVSRWKKTGQMSRTLHVEDRQWTLRYWIRRMREAIVLYGESRSHESKITLPYLSAT